MDALGKFGEHSRSYSCSRLSPRATLTLLSCSPNFPRASITRYTHAKHEPILKYETPKRSIAVGILINKFVVVYSFETCSHEEI